MLIRCVMTIFTINVGTYRLQHTVKYHMYAIKAYYVAIMHHLIDAFKRQCFIRDSVSSVLHITSIFPDRLYNTLLCTLWFTGFGQGKGSWSQGATVV